MTPRQSTHRQTGVALITSLLVVALATVIAGSALWDHHLDQRRTASLLYTDQALMYALGAEAWAGRILIEDARDSSNDHPGEAWAFNLPPLPIEGGSVDGALIDLQGRFNLNNLIDGSGNTDPIAVAQFQRMLDVLELDRRWARLMADWIDLNIEPNFPEGAEDSVYMGMDPPHRAINAPVTSITELMSLPEMDRDTFEILRPHIAALPRGSTLNINTASAPVLQSLSEDLSVSEATRIMEDRPEDGYADVAELEDKVPAELIPGLSVTSRYFRMAVKVNVGTVDFTMYSLLEREGPESVRTLLRSYGTE